MKEKRHSIDGVFVLLVFGVLAAAVLLVLLLGANRYQVLADRDEESYDRRIAVQYVASKVRESDASGRVFLGSFSDPDDPFADAVSTLYLTQEVDGTEYDTRVYYYDGAVRELFAAADGEFAPEDGNEVLPADGLTFSQSGRLLTVTSTDPDGEVTTLRLFLRSGEGAGT